MSEADLKIKFASLFADISLDTFVYWELFKREDPQNDRVSVKSLRKIKLRLLLTLSLYSLSAGAEEQEFKPILPLPESKLETIPLMELVLRDARQDLILKTAEEATDAAENANELDEDYASATDEKARIAFDAMRLNIALAYYLEDMGLGLTKGKPVAKLPEVRARIVKYATDLVTLGANPAIKERAAFHVRAQNQLLGKVAPTTVVATKAPKGPAPDGPYRFQLEFLDALTALADESAVDRATAQMLKLSSSMEGYGYFASAMATARALAGIDNSGKKVRDTKPNYQTYLQKATLLVEKYDEPLKQKVLTFSVALWTLAEEDGINWMKTPIGLQAFDGLEELDAINERRAYALFNGNKAREALDIFTKLLAENEASVELGKLTERYLELQFLDGKKTHNFDTYIQSLHRVNNAFKSNDVLGDGGEAAVKKYRKKFHTLFYLAVLNSLKSAQQPKAAATDKAAAQRHAQLFLPRAQDDKEKVRVLGEMGSLHLQMKNYPKAVEAYLQAEKLSQKPYFLSKAIEAQQALARWPVQPPWDKEPPGDRAARKKLTTLYQMLNKKKSPNWFALAHIGLLQKNTGTMDAAVKTWLPFLSKEPQNPHVARAAGVMVEYFQVKKKWLELVGLLQMSVKHQIEIKQRGKPVDANKLLADALYAAGNQASLKRDPKLALRFYRIFNSQFKEDPRLAETLFKSGMAYNDLKDQEKFVLAMKVVVKTFPKTKWARDAIRKGMDLAKDESHRVYFLEAFLKHSPQSPEATAVREKLAKIYVGLTMYPKAIVLYQAQEKDPRTQPAAKVAANMRIIELSEKAGLPNPGLAAAQRITKLSNAPHDALAKSYALYAKHYAQQKQFDMVDHYAKLSDKLSVRDKNTAESIAQIRYLVALRSAAKPFNQPDPRTIKDPSKEMQNQVVVFQGLKVPFDKVCQLGATNACKLARRDLSNLAQRSYDAVNAIELAQAPDNKTLQAFAARKKQALQAISVSIQKSMAH